ncbi:betaine--homocysteine S-methyltransferase [Billgrantia tianxiuensis]|jgi:5-methyltetrahydrofolate--homocysteine methyltransferase|uniref:Betaine--homocysteine S-methyltransferase n=1 Tax=Billgrantia tianxiuensis TaxID=2497861 RepID=A0A6I6SM97_9GAMM|nr:MULTISPECIES: betaine--homocysteine S-methyltransferase [Halomonas]MCE8035002.1 betaine--homocysteine S-methyltransferase [Halomonas sp. MCCC 1A11057]QHC48485.1 betaine--homocysteine S-methyltransferase [Halomonas tianxiuensis]
MDSCNKLEQILTSRDWLLADGATGTNLFDMGLTSGEAPELWNELYPRRIARMYTLALEAGSDIFLTNSFGSNAARLRLHGSQHRARELSRLSAAIARDVADRYPRPIVVAGSVGPTGEIMSPLGSLTHELAVEIFHEQAEGLKEGGADVLWLETMSSIEELQAASDAFKLASMPWCGTMSFDTAGRTMMGVTAQSAMETVGQMPNMPVAFGANCGVGASDLMRTVLNFTSQGNAVPIIAKGNAGIPEYFDGHIRYSGTPELMADYAVLARDAGAKIIGGCCGTTPEHLARMRAALEERPRGERPTLEQIRNVLGEFSSVSDDHGKSREGPNRRNRRSKFNK